MNKKVRLENGYAKLTEMLGLELGQEFNIVGKVKNFGKICNPYHFEKTGLYDGEGYWIHLPLHGLLLGEVSIEIVPLLTLEESSYLHNLRMICGNIDTIQIVEECEGRIVMYCVDDCETSVVEIVVVDNLFGTLELNREYTWEELGLDG